MIIDLMLCGVITLAHTQPIAPGDGYDSQEKATRMKIKTLTLLTAASCFGMLTACASPEQAAANRAAHMQQLFPNPADRAGLHLVFPIDRKALVTYYPNEINDAQAMQKMTKYCQTPFPGSRAVKTKTTEAGKSVLADGTEVVTSNMTVECRS